MKISRGQTRAAVCFPRAGNELMEDNIFGFLAVECDVVRGLALLFESFFNETVINPPAELGRLTDAGGGEQSIKIENSAV